MQFLDALCYALLTITITSTCVDGRYSKQELVERRSDRRGKRDSAVIIEGGYSSNTGKPNLIFDRVSNSKTKYHSTPKYGHNRPKYGRSPPKNRGKSMKKYRRKLVGTHKYSKNLPQMTPLPVNTKPVNFKNSPGSAYNTPKLWNAYHHYYVSEPASFAEPPKFVNPEIEPNPKKTYGEPPVDSYGMPVKHPILHNVAESYGLHLKQPHAHTAEPFAETPKNGNFDQQYQSYQSYKQDINVDNVDSYSKYHPVYLKQEQGVDEENQPPDPNSSLNSYADVYKQSLLNDLSSIAWNQKKKHYLSVLKNQPWKSKIKNGDVDEQHPQKHIMVGGQYAEPPGHMIPEFQSSVPHEFPAEADIGHHISYLDTDFAASASISPYVNYKNSNMAFSPQNLNDAFSL